ncbi:MAG: hypothetical protein SGI83_12850 [Bacteroidota bacterium]|nr:hypothetical protein [Bacteroidota bacterium]
MNILIDFHGREPVKQDDIGNILFLELEKKGFSLFYNDVFDHYSTIDFRKDGYKYNIMLIPKRSSIECSTSVYKNFFPRLLKKYNREKLSSFFLLVKTILALEGIIKGTTI